MSIPSSEVFEKLASFYLGRQYDLRSGELLDDLLMYDARDLCTHAMCVGMTGSGKTGLCISMLEEAALDGIPAICIDPKGDLANLLLTFPELRPTDFKPWLEEGEAVRQGISVDRLAEETSALWREGLAFWGQSPERIARLQQSVDMAIYTPGSKIGLPLTVLRSFDAPPPDLMQDTEAIADRITGAVSGLLALMGMEADPMTSPEHILISSILQRQWGEDQDVSLSQLVRLIQKPPLERVGVIDLDSFMSDSDRGKLAMRLNNILASPAFASWLEGESLSIKNLLRTSEGRPRLSIISIAHLSDRERMFFVTILLNELLAWVRSQSGTSSLRALFYMDEVAGYFPPVSNPPSKQPMLTLLKQARAFGLGITLATQNPIDLDYKGLSNIGTWFLGRLQTQRDKERVLDGLEGAAGQVGNSLDRGNLDRVLSALKSRVFLMNNVHDGSPRIFQTRWAMSYLAGPLARRKISQLMADRKSEIQTRASAVGQPGGTAIAGIAGDRVRQPEVAGEAVQSRPAVPAGVEERFVEVNQRSTSDMCLLYLPALYAEGSMHFVRKTADLDVWKDARRFVLCDHDLPQDLWESSVALSQACELIDQPEHGFRFQHPPAQLLNAGKYRSYKSRFKDYLYRHNSVVIYKSALVRGYAPVGDQSDAMAFFQQQIREKRDHEIDQLREKYAARIASQEKKLRTAQQRLDRERSQSRTSTLNAGSSILGVLLGGFLGGRRTKVSTAVRGIGYATQQGDDVRRSEAAIRLLEEDKKQLEADLANDLDRLRDQYNTDAVELESKEIPPRKSDLIVTDPLILWLPFQVDQAGHRLPLFDNDW